MARAIDHLVIAVPDLGASADHYRRLGFTVGGENRHPWGTVNRVVRLDGVYLELIVPGPGFEAPPPGDPARHFAVTVADAAARGGALAMLAFSSEDADADAAAFAAAGTGAGRLDFSRDARGPDGRPRVLRFGLAFVHAPPLGLAHLFTCRHHQPFGDGAVPPHANGALALGGVAIEVSSVADCAPVLEAVIGAPPRGPAGASRFDTATGRIDLVPWRREGLPRRREVAGRLRSFAVEVGDLDRLRADLARAGLDHEAGPGRVTLPASPLQGAELAFVPAPCHSGP